MSQATVQGVYFRLAVTGLLRTKEEEFSRFCFEGGALGVAEKLAFSQPDAVYEPIIVETQRFDANVYFSTRPSAGFIAQLGDAFEHVSAHGVLEPNKDWLEEWKKGFEPFLFVEPFWIVPSWRERPRQAREVIWVDPGMAFGTGTHETTKLAAALLVEVMTARSGDAPSVIDVGSGTGVLAIVAKRSGAGRVTAIDNDPEAMRVARENFIFNGLNDAIEAPDLALEDVLVPYDVVVANIIDGVLVGLQPNLSRALGSGGSMIVSGILLEREADFISRFLPPSGLIRRRRQEMGEWVAFELAAPELRT